MNNFSELDLLASPIEPGLTVIEASAGTGKTYSISHLVPRLLLSGALPDLSKLLLVTFTKDAARELAERVRRVLTQLSAPPTPDEDARAPHVHDMRPLLANADARTRLERALVDLDLLAVSTIHAFCQRTLQQEGSLCGLPVMPEVTTDDAEHLTPLVREHWLATLAKDSTLAAIATARGWELEAAVKFINSLRRCHRPHSEPAVTPFAELRAQLAELCAQLAEPARVASLCALLEEVPKWNRGLSTAEAREQIAPVGGGESQRLPYWQGVSFASELPSLINKQSKSGKIARAAVEAHPWMTAVTALQTVLTQLEWAWHHELAAAAIPQLSRVLEARRLITQDGLIGAVYRALHRTTAEGAGQSARLAAHLAERYHVALIDESQDTDPRQFAIFQRIFLESSPRRRLILVGDPKQAIYGFRGANLSTYLAARAHADHGYTLTHTHRAPPALVATINGLFGRRGAFHHPDMDFRPATSALAYDRQLYLHGRPCSRLEAWIVPEAETESYTSQARRIPQLSHRIATTIVELLHHGTLRTTSLIDGTVESRRVSPRDFAVLVSTNAQATAMAEALQLRAVPAVVNSGADVFASDEARELHTLLSAVLDPRRTRRVRRALATRLLGLNAQDIDRLDAPSADGSQPSVLWLERFTRWNQLWNSRGLAALLSDLESLSIAVTHRLALQPLTGERRTTNHRHLTDLLLEATREEAPRPAECVRWLGQQIARATDRSQVEERQLQLSSDREAVQVVTMHKAKGLEYPLVFCPYLADPLRRDEGVRPLPAARNAGEGPTSDLLVNLDLLDEEAKDRRTRELAAAQLEERLRLAYVALTRAQVRVWICSYSNAPRMEQGTALDWLLRTDDELSTYPAYSGSWVDTARRGRSARHTAVLAALGGSAPDNFTVGAPPCATPDCFNSGAGTEGAPTAPVPLPAPPVPRSWRITSFSTLTREKHAHGIPAGHAPEALVSAGETTAPADPTAPLFFCAPGGAAVGTAVHDWIESWDFCPIDAPALHRHLAAAQLPPTKADDPKWATVLEELFAILRAIRLPGCGTTPLHDLCPETHASEWHFHLPLAGELSARDLAWCFEHHAAPAHRPYAAALRELSEEKFHGLLQGFIDRLARCGSAWGVIDWKTNRLGPALSAYDDAGLLRCAFNEHYLLQTHLYLVALRRYLRALGVDQPPLAGAWLVFLRAISPRSTRGVLHIDPPGAMLDALDALFAPAQALAP